jgi:hypothetical protein
VDMEDSEVSAMPVPWIPTLTSLEPKPASWTLIQPGQESNSQDQSMVSLTTPALMIQTHTYLVLNCQALSDHTIDPKNDCT